MYVVSNGYEELGVLHRVTRMSEYSDRSKEQRVMTSASDHVSEDVYGAIKMLIEFLIYSHEG